jgi:hypothetical protein
MDKVMYSIGDLNNRRLNLVCRVSDEETFERLKRLCPHMHEYYDEECDYYITSRGGRGVFRQYDGYDCPDDIPYKLISVLEIEGFWDDKNVFEYGNGVPMVWDEL